MKRKAAAVGRPPARPPTRPRPRQDLNYSVPSAIAKGERAYLIKSVSGHLETGKMAALMGPSGSGKTTLLDLLAGRKTTGTIEGDLRFAGHVGSREFLRRYTGYVEQFGACAGWGRHSRPARGGCCIDGHSCTSSSLPLSHPPRRHAAAISNRV